MILLRLAFSNFYLILAVLVVEADTVAVVNVDVIVVGIHDNTGTIYFDTIHEPFVAYWALSILAVVVVATFPGIALVWGIIVTAISITSTTTSGMCCCCVSGGCTINA